jgi:hypothetical protein
VSEADFAGLVVEENIISNPLTVMTRSDIIREFRKMAGAALDNGELTTVGERASSADMRLCKIRRRNIEIPASVSSVEEPICCGCETSLRKSLVKESTNNSRLEV